MNVATEQLDPPRLVPLPRIEVEPGRCVLLEAVEWPAYEQIGEALRDRPHVRMTFDRGRLEIMTLSLEHERLKVLLDRLLQVLAEHLGGCFIALNLTSVFCTLLYGLVPNVP